MLTVVVHAMSLLQGLRMLDHGSPQNHKRTVTVISPKNNRNQQKPTKEGSRVEIRTRKII